jgi:uncharacterized ion transporter superfamily protein YfcC
MELDKNNLSTIFVFVYMLIAPILVKYGYDINQEIFVSAMVAIVGLIGATYSAMNPNKMKCLGNAPESDENTRDSDDI